MLVTIIKYNYIILASSKLFVKTCDYGYEYIPINQWEWRWNKNL